METNNENAIWQELSSISRTTETNMDSLKRKRTGSYYTDLELTDLMMEELVSHLVSGHKKIYEYSFLEPCVGSGNFVFSYLKSVNKIGINSEDASKLLNNIYVSDINDNALKAYKYSLIKVANLYWGISLDESYFSNHIGKGLLIDVTASELKYTSIDKVFPDINNRFDIVVTNPPYKNLKAERNQYATDEEYETDKGKYNSISEIVKNSFTYSVSGVLNLYKLFVEEIIDRYANSDAYISLLIPSSILSDKTCAKLRTHILKDMNLISAKIIGEGSKYIDANQALCALLISKVSRTSSVKITKDFCKNPDKSVDVLISDILNDNTDNSVIAIDESEYERLKVLRKHKVVKELDFITNLRGELDLTANKKEIVCENTGYRLLRGKDINYYEISNSETIECASNTFVETTKKRKYIDSDRIICQQIANMHKARRVTFAYIPSHMVLANSCNFISVSDNEYGIDIYALLGIFNTKIIDWYFKLTSSNNHINNYEIDCFPVPVNAPEMQLISTLVKRYLTEKDEKILDEIESLAELAYGKNLVRC